MGFSAAGLEEGSRFLFCKHLDFFFTHLPSAGFRVHNRGFAGAIFSPAIAGIKVHELGF